MKKLFTLFCFILAASVSPDLIAQNFPDLDKSPADIASYPRNNPIVKVVYGRPLLKGRDLSQLIPEGKVWRTGANESTEITFFRDVNFGGTDVKAGTYTLFSVWGANGFTVILNSNLNTWGTYGYNPEKDILRANTSISDLDKPLEAFSMTFTETNDIITLHMGWDTKTAAVQIK